jgi:antitoxin component of MazEF toxin-antitoxin module
MTKYIQKVGNSNALIFDRAFMDIAHAKTGDPYNITIHDGGAIMLTPLNPAIPSKKAADTAKRIIKKNSKLFRRLS